MVALGAGRSGCGVLVPLVRRVLHGGPLPAPRSAARVPAAPRRHAAAVMLVALVATHARWVPGTRAAHAFERTAPTKNAELARFAELLKTDTDGGPSIICTAIGPAGTAAGVDKP